jgi:uncharacterized membrane protein YfhO
VATRIHRADARRQNDGHRGLLLYLAYALVIVLLLSLYFLLRHRAFAFVDIGIDSYSFYYAFQIAQARQLHQLHTLTWSFDAGLGSYIGWMSDALQYFAALFPESWQLGLRLPIYFLKLLLAGGFLFGYLRRLGFEAKQAVIGGLALAFCGYAMCNGQWDTQGYVIAQLAAYLFCFESYLRNRNRWFAVAAGLVVGSGAVFDTYTFALLTALYVIVRPLLVNRDQDAGAYLPSLLRYAGWAALGVLVTAAIQLPNMLYFFASPRVSGNHSLLHTLLGEAWSLNSGKIISAELAGLFGKGLLGTGSDYHGWSNWFEAPGFYVGMLLLVCIPQLLGPNASRRERWMCMAGMGLLVAYILWPFMRYAVYGFGHRGFRLSTLWVSLGLLMLGLAGLRRIARTGAWWKGLVASGTILIIAMLAVAGHGREHVDVPHLAVAIAFTLLYCVLLWPRVEAKGQPRVSMAVLVCVFACELLIFAIPPMMDRNAVKTDDTSSVGSYHDGTAAALALVRRLDGTGDFYRVEKTYRSVYLNDALVQDYSGTKSYFFHGKSVTRFVDRMHLPRPHPRTNYIGSMVNRPKVLDLLGVRYLLARDRKLDKVSRLEYLGSAGKIHVYRNKNAHGIAHLYTEVAGEDQANDLSQRRRDALLLDKILVDDPASIRERLAELDAHGSGSPVPAHVSLSKPSDIQLHADISSNRAGVLLITMPFESGWTAKLDGESIGLFRADYGLTALLVPPGRHQVDLRYAVPGKTLGTWLSLAALLVLLAVATTQMVTRHRLRKSADATRS